MDCSGYASDLTFKFAIQMGTGRYAYEIGREMR